MDTNVGEIRKDPSDGELAVVEALLTDDDGDPAGLEVRVAGQEALVTFDDEDNFQDTYEEHVLEPGETWRLHNECTSTWVGTDVEIVGATLEKIHWRVVRPGPLFNKDAAKRFRELQELEELSKFLQRFRFVGSSAATISEIDPHVATDAERKAAEEDTKDRTEIGGLLASLMGLDKPVEELDAKAKQAKEPDKTPWAPGQVRCGNILNISGTDAGEKLALIPEMEFEVLGPVPPGTPGLGEGRAPLWLVKLTDGTSRTGLKFRESWPNALVKDPSKPEAERKLTWKVGQVRKGPIFAMRDSPEAGEDELFEDTYTIEKPDVTGSYDWRVKLSRDREYGVCENWPSELLSEKEAAEGQLPGTQSSEKGTGKMGTDKSTGAASADKVAQAIAILNGTTEPDFKDVTVARGGAQVVLPTGMTTKAAIKWLQRIDEEDEREVAVHHEIQCYPIEGAYALYRALKEKYGFVSLAATPTFLGSKPPVLVGFDVSLTEHVQVPWGRMQIPNVAGHLETGAELKPNGEFRFVLSGKTKRRDEEEINALVALVREFATTRSIYRGQAIRVTFPTAENFDFTYTPKFIDTREVKEEELVFPAEVQEMVNTALFAPIEKTAMCRKLKVPLKRGILLEGPFGVGKTLAAYVTAKKCVENGWTFMYLEKTADLKQAIQLARSYMPCVIFAEDIDRAVEGEERTEEMDAILNTIDGIDNKTSEILVVLTTNNVDKINKAMLRPGRLDAVIPVRLPDDAAARQLVINYSRGLLRQGEDLTEVGNVLRGMIPASIRETVERSKLAATWRLPEGTDRVELTANDLVVAARSMQAQLDLMKTPLPDERSDIEKAFALLADAVTGAATRRGDQQVVVEKPTNGAGHHALPSGTQG